MKKNHVIVLVLCLLFGSFFAWTKYAGAVPVDPTTIGDALVQHWKFDEGVQGTTLINNGSAGTTSTLGGDGPTYSTDVPTTSFSDSYSAVFNGIDQYVQVNYRVTSTFSVAFWFKTATSGPSAGQFYQAMGLVDAEHVAPGDWGIAWGNQKVGFGMSADGIDRTIFTTDTLSLDTWHHVVGVWSSDTGVMALYIDGSFNTSTLTTTSTRDVNEFRIGGTQTGTNYFDGQIDDVRIYTMALSTSTITALAAGGPSAAPTDFATSASGTTTTLTWTNPADFSSLTLVRSTSTFPSSTDQGTIVFSGSVATSYSDSGLSDGTYYYSLFALDSGDNESDPATSTVIIDTTSPDAPGLPSGPAATSSTEPTISWDAAADAGIGLADVPYLVEWSTSSDFTSFSSTTVSSTSFAPTSSLADGAWYFRVQASDQYGNTSTWATSSDPVLVDTVAPVLTPIQTIGRTVYQDSVAYYFYTAETTPTGAHNSLHLSFLSSCGSGAAVHSSVGFNTTTYASFTFSGDQTGHSFGCSFSVTDAAHNISNSLTIGPFEIVPRSVGGGGGSVVPLAGGGSASSDFIVTINSSTTGTIFTKSRALVLQFNASSNVVGYAIAMTPDFAGAGILPYTSTTLYQLPDQPATYTLYVKFYSSTGNASNAVTRTVVYHPSVAQPVASSVPASLATSRTTTFTRNLKRGSRGTDVFALQQFLNAHGFAVADSGPGSSGSETIYYGPGTAAAVSRFQEANSDLILKPFNLKKGTGYFYTATRAVANTLSF